MDRRKILMNIVEYLYKKNIDTYINDSNELIWIYKKHYSEFKISIYLYYDYYDKIYVKYYLSEGIDGYRRRRTSVKKDTTNFIGVYKNLIYFKEKLDTIAESKKKEIDIKKKYSTEIEMFYKRKHNKVRVNAYDRTTKDDISVNISVYGYDKNDVTTSYSLECTGNKYFLKNKTINLNKKLNMKPLK